MSVEDQKKTRHILSLSGGKDSTALAIFMRDKVEDMEYVFCDTDQELPETYEYLDKLEVFLGEPIIRLKHEGKGFDELLQMRRGFLPSSQVRWCTELLKIKPFEKHLGDDPCISYIGIRADEADRKGYLSTKPNITSTYPFIEYGIYKEDVYRILMESGLGVPDYYKWRSRSGCYFCFFQQRIEWVGLLENHPELYERAKKYERIDTEIGERYTWYPGESLEELQNPVRIRKIKEEFNLRMSSQQKKFDKNQPLTRIFMEEMENDQNRGCLICHL